MLPPKNIGILYILSTSDNGNEPFKRGLDMLRVRLACLVIAMCCSAVFVKGQQHEPAPGAVYTIPVAITGPDPALVADEGLLFVPENRTKPGSRITSVHFLRLRCTSPGARPPIFLLPGAGGILRP